jgi:hypothetical protein
VDGCSVAPIPLRGSRTSSVIGKLHCPCRLLSPSDGQTRSNPKVRVADYSPAIVDSITDERIWNAELGRIPTVGEPHRPARLSFLLVVRSHEG